MRTHLDHVHRCRCGREVRGNAYHRHRRACLVSREHAAEMAKRFLLRPEDQAPSLITPDEANALIDMVKKEHQWLMDQITRRKNPLT